MSIVVDKRNAGCGVIFEDQLYVWGGETVDIRRPYDEMPNDSSDDDSSEEEEEDEDENLVIETVVTLPRPNDKDHPFDVLDLTTRKWSRQPTSGEVPSVGNGSSLNIHYPTRSFLLYGGWNDGNFNAEIFKVSVDDWKWELVRLSSKVKPSPRYLTGVIIHKNRMCMFGGVGKDIIEDQDPGAEYVGYIHETGVARDFGVNNEYYEFDITKNVWVALLGKQASRPPPTGAFAFTKFDQHRAVMFGGNRSRQERTNDVFIFNLDERIPSGCIIIWSDGHTSSDPAHTCTHNKKWSQPITPPPNQQWPLKNRFGTLTPLIDPDIVGHRLCEVGSVLKQRVVLLWGKDTHHHISPETWLLDLNSLPNIKWTRLNIPAKPRSWHIARPRYSRTSTGCEIVVFGGNVHIEGHYGDRDNTADLKILSFGVRTLISSCLSVIVQSERLMSQLSTLTPPLPMQIKCAHEAYLNYPTDTKITVVGL